MKRFFIQSALAASLFASVSTTLHAQQPVAVSPWGVAAGHDTGWGVVNWAPDVAAAGVRTVRGFADYPGTFTVLEQNGFKAKGILQWSPAGQPYGFPANHLVGWADYVRDIVTRYAGRVDAWEIWNEPPNFTADTSPASYAKIVKVAYDTAKAAVPGVRIGLAAKSAHVRWLAESIEAGAAGHYDYITLHPYETAALVRQGWDAQYLAIVPTVRKMLAEKDPARAGVPIEFTEVGIPTNWPSRSFPQAVPEPVQADELVKYYAMGIAQGVSQIDWFEAWDGDTPDPATSDAPFGLIQRDARKRPAYTALKSLITELGSTPTYLGWTDFDGRGRGFYFSTPFGGQDWTVLVAWSDPGQQIPLQLAGAVSVVKPIDGVENEHYTQTVQLTSSPLILSTTPGTIATAWRQDATQSRSRPFSWGGDHSSATSVSIAAGQPDQGLHWIDKPAAVQVGGVLAHPMAGRSVASFTVDPNFLSWTARRITITATVRRTGGGDAGFNLKYESTAPLSTADGNGLSHGPSCWCGVPVGGSTQLSWTIDNPRFVGMFGYHFSLDSDSPQYAHYAIERITVTKTP